MSHCLPNVLEHIILGVGIWPVSSPTWGEGGHRGRRRRREEGEGKGREGGGGNTTFQVSVSVSRYCSGDCCVYVLCSAHV